VWIGGRGLFYRGGAPEALEAGGRAGDTPLAEHERRAVASLNLATFPPVMRVRNVAEEALGSGGETGSLAVSCRIESEIMAIEDPAERVEFLQAAGLESSGLDRMNTAVYDALGLMSFYTQGEDECRAWTIHKGYTAPQAAGVIHSDFEKGFIKAEVMSCRDLLELGSEAAVKDKGLLRVEGKEYLVQDGDCMHFRFNVTT